MAVTENLYTGNGSTTNYSFTFPYLATTDIKVSLNSVITTAYTFANATTVQFNTAPANGVAIRIYRDTDDSNLNATFYSGSAIRAQDLNDNFTQNLYVTQEAVNTADSATTTAASALSTANTALSNSTAAVSTANTAASNAATAVSTANTASANASTAVSTANAATATANTALSNSTTAISTANTASSNATAAVNTANSAASDASTALSLVNNVIDYQIILNVASIPGSPVDGDRIEVVDSTGIESFTPLTGIPGGFTGAAGLSVRMSYDGTGSTWVWYDYSPSDPDSRYILDSTGTVTSTNILNGTIVDGDINASAEIAVSKLADGAARQLLQTDAAGTGVEWTDNVDIPGTLDVVGAATFDSSATIVGDLTVDTNTLYVDSTNNRVGVGTTPVVDLDVAPAASAATFRIHARSDTTPVPAIELVRGTNTTFGADGYGDYRIKNDAGNLAFEYGDTGVTTERARIDSSGRLLVGTSSSSSLSKLVVGGGAGTNACRMTLAFGTSTPFSGDTLGAYDIADSGQVTSARIEGQRDGGTWTSGSSQPTRLVFSTTPSGSASPTGRMRIDSRGVITTASDASSDYALRITNDGNSNNRYGLRIQCGRDDSTGSNIAVNFSDGDGTVQGYITFTSGTVTYGAFTAHHLCSIPDADNENGYPYGTLLEVTGIKYTQKDGKNTERGILYDTRKTQSANSRAVLGAYGVSMNGGPDGETNCHQVLVLGDGHILCNNSGGDIKVGDGICSSATPGIGQKATATPSMVIGIAQEDVTFADGEEVKLVAVQYGLHQFIPWGD